jgi:hypothetical protein
MNTKPLRVAGCFLAVAILPVVALPGVAQTAPARHGLDQAPAGLVAAITRTEAQEAAANPAYAIGKNGCASLPAGSKGSTLAGCFGRHGPAFSTGKEQLNLQLAAWGRAGRLQPVTLTRTAQQANRIEYRGPHIAEWVEDAGTLAVLWQCGVNYIQGYFLQEPDVALSYDFSEGVL